MLFVFVAVSAGLWNETKNHQCSHHCSCRAQLAQNRCNFVIWLTRTNRFQLPWRLAWLHSPYAWNDQPMDVWKGSIYPRMHMRTNAMIDPQQLERRPNCVVGLSSQCCSRHAGKMVCSVPFCFWVLWPTLFLPFSPEWKIGSFFNVKNHPMYS